MRLRHALAAALLALPGATPSLAAGGGGDLLVAPTRVVLEGRTRSESLTLRNVGTKTALYRISLGHFRMSDDGRTEMIADPGADEALAASLVRFSPRQVLLQPGESQVVRILARKPADLAEGEYRTHLVVRAVPGEAPDAAEPRSRRTSGWSVELDPIFGVSLPVILRHGATSAEVAVSAARLLPAGDGRPARVEVVLDREGTRSGYGDLAISSRDGTVLGQARGVAVWTPNATRRIAVPLTAEVLSPGELVATYTERDSGRPSRHAVTR